MPQNCLSFAKKFSIRWRAVYVCRSNLLGSFRLAFGGMIAFLPASANGSGTRFAASNALPAIRVPPPWPATARRRLPGRGPDRRSGENRWGCPVHRRGHGFWCSVRLGIVRWPGPRRLFLGTRAVLVGADDRAVDHRVFVVGIRRQIAKNLLPNAGFRPAAEAAMHVLPIAEPLREVPPRDAGTVPV